MAKPQVAKSEPKKAPYAKPKILTFKPSPSFASIEIEPLLDLEHKNEEPRIGWVGYLGVVIGSIAGYVLFRIIYGSAP